jgi:hypothetical protein
MRKMSELGQEFDTGLQKAKASGNKDLEWYLINLFGRVDGNGEASVVRWREQLA